jgi:hypothetical protein
MEAKERRKEGREGEEEWEWREIPKIKHIVEKTPNVHKKRNEHVIELKKKTHLVHPHAGGEATPGSSKKDSVSFVNPKWVRASERLSLKQ